MPTREVTTWHYEITDPAQLRPAMAPATELHFMQAKQCVPSFGLFLNNAVGSQYNWVIRKSWTTEQWHEFWDRPELEVWVAYAQGTPVGFFELESQPNANAEIVKFGMFPEFTGRGFGGAMLTYALQRGFSQGARRVWLHTCSLDHPTARAHYEARGMRLFQTDQELRQVSP